MQQYMVILIIGLSVLPAWVQAADLHPNRAHIALTLLRLAKEPTDLDAIDIDTAFKRILPKEVTQLIKRMAYYETFNTFFVHDVNRYHCIKQARLFLFPATNEEKQFLIKPTPNIAAAFSRMAMICAMNYGTEVIMANAEHKMVVYDLITQDVTDGWSIKHTSPTTYLYKGCKDSINNIVAVGHQDGTVSLFILSSRREINIPISPDPITLITLCDSGKTALIASDTTIALVRIQDTLTKVHLFRKLVDHPDSITGAGFYHNGVIIQANNAENAATYRLYSADDAEKLASCNFSFAQASLMARLIDAHKGDAQPTVPENEQHIFATLSPSLQALLMSK